MFEGPKHIIDLPSLMKGNYFITIEVKDFLRTEKIIKLQPQFNPTKKGVGSD